MATIGKYDGELVIIDEWIRHLDKPEDYRSYWTTGTPIYEWEHLIGMSACRDLHGGYRVALPFTTLTIHVRQQGAVHRETRPVPKPRRKHEQYWYLGEWRTRPY